MKAMRCLFLLVLVLIPPLPFNALPTSAAPARPDIPATWAIVTENFDGDGLDGWKTVSATDLSLVPAGGYLGSAGLGVNVSQHASYIYQADTAYAEEAYLTFWFHPNSISIPGGTGWVPGESISLASVRHSGGDWWPPLVALYLHQPAGQGYQAYLAWPVDASGNRHFDFEAGAFEVVNGWQQLTIGYRVNEWVAVWRNGELMRHATGVVHTDPYGDVIELGKTNDSTNTPAGIMLFDAFAFQLPRIDDLWVDAAHGDDGNDGLASPTALRTIQRAAELAGPGTAVHVQPGIYRETVHPVMNGTAAEPVRYLAENGPGTAIIRGSEASASLPWAQLAANTIGLPSGVDPAAIWYTDLSAWGMEGAPRFVVDLAAGREAVARLPLAREPDWEVSTEWKHHELWWAADGGWAAASCDPATDPDPNCDYASRSMYELTDSTDDVAAPGIEPGNLTTVGNLTGATLRAIDARQGHYIYRRTIVAHDVGAGRITVDRCCEHDMGSGDPALGWGSKYYVEGLPSLLDSPGEWWYDSATGYLYLWPRTPGNPALHSIEISRRDVGFDLSHRSYITLEGLDLEFLNGSAVHQSNWSAKRSYHNTVRHVTARYANYGVWVEQSTEAGLPDNITAGFTLEQSEIGYMDTLAIRLTDWWGNDAAPDTFTHSGVVNTLIRDNELHHLGFRTDDDNAIGVALQFANKLRFEGNHVHHVAHNGVQIIKSVIQSPKTYGFDADEIKTGEIVIKDNVFEKACQLTTDCGALKVWGSPPDSHVFRDLLITGNVLRDTFGWSYVSEKRGGWAGGVDSQVQGLGGFGLYVDMASGLHAYRNVAYNNAYAGYLFSGVWRDGDMLFYNNVAANSLYGFRLTGASFDTHEGSVNTQLVNNVVMNNEGYGVLQEDEDGVHGNLAIDHNLYFGNGWRPWEAGGLWRAGDMAIYRVSAANEYYPTLGDIQVNTTWEAHGRTGDPHLWSYDLADHDLHDGSRPDLHPTANSDTLIDRGSAVLPGSLEALVSTFVIEDLKRGLAYDIGRYEAGFGLVAVPGASGTAPGGTALYTLRLFPADLPFEVALTAANPPDLLTLSLQPEQIDGQAGATLSITDWHPEPTLLPGVSYRVTITGSGGGFVQPTSVYLIVGGARFYLPLALKR
jgi:hypothetical protein